MTDVRSERIPLTPHDEGLAQSMMPKTERCTDTLKQAQS